MSRPLAVVTGASSGLGAEFARQIAARGYDLLLVARRGERLEEVARTIRAVHSVECNTLSNDLTNPDDLAKLESLVENSPNLGLLVNNAGFGTVGKFWRNTLDSQDRMHRLHVIAPMRLCHAALRGMVTRDRGAIINVSSVSAYMTGPGATSYSATKTWMNRFTEGLDLELRISHSRVKVQALCPGYTRTEFHRSLNMDPGTIPGWMWLSAERVVRESLAALASDRVFVIPGRRYRSIVRIYSMLPAGPRRKLSIIGGRRRQGKG